MAFPKRNRTQDKQKKKHSISDSFRKFNPDKITGRGIKNFLIYNFYRIGCCIEALGRELADVSGRLAETAYEFFVRVGRSFWKFAKLLFDSFLDDLGEPIMLIGTVLSNIKSIRDTTKDDKDINTTQEITKYIKQGVKKHRDAINILTAYALPVFCGMVFLSVAYLGLHRELALRVYVNDTDIGLISNYSVLDNAGSIIENQLVATNDQVWELDSKVKIVPLGREKTVSERTLADNILNASDADVARATGLYVNNEFIGAVEDSAPLMQALAELKAPYENGDENRTVSFVQDVRIEDGIYFSDSIVPDTKLANLVKSEVSGQKTYTVVSGDSPSAIASKNDITLKQLYSLNPGLEGGGLWVGDILVVSASVPFLQVKYIERITRQVEVPFASKQEKNSSLTYGKTQISQKGERGVNEEIVDQTYIDGIYQSENIIQTTVIKEPVTQITQVGTNLNGIIIENTGTGRLMWPVPGYTYMSRGFYGQYPSHNGLDICGAYGTPIYAADNGVVTTALYTNRGYGVYCIIEHGGYQTLYGHCSSLVVSAGQQVKKGQLIAYMGSTGNSSGNHCHFEVKNGSYRYNPMSWF